MKSARVALIAAAMFAVQALALATTNTSAGTTIGNHDCGQWFNPQRREIARWWLLGYLSGLNGMYQMNVKREVDDPLAELGSADQAYLWMDNYCKANPLKNVNNGAVFLFVELLQKKTR